MVFDAASPMRRSSESTCSIVRASWSALCATRWNLSALTALVNDFVEQGVPPETPGANQVSLAFLSHTIEKPKG